MRHVVPASFLLAMLCLHGAALANGLELLPGGTRSVGRGGATAARAEDAMLLIQNPAGLAMLSGHHFMLDLDLPIHDMCVDPYGFYGWGVYNDSGSEFGSPTALDDPTNPTIGATYATTPLEPVCNSASTLPIPQLAWAGKITDEFALGLGFVAPTVVPGLRFGGADGTVQTAFGPRPTPTRYTLIEQDVTNALAPSVGAAYRPIPELSAGVGLQVIMVRAQATQVQNNVSGTQPATDWLATVTTQDFFVPALTFSLHGRPIPALNLMAGFRWSDDLRGSGDVVYETNTFHRGATSGPVPFENDPIALEAVTVRLPWQLTAGVRYAGMLANADEGGDPMDTELWDVEVDFAYTFNERASINSVEPGEDATVVTRDASGEAGSNTVRLEDLSVFEIDRRLTDFYTIRLGASYSVAPRKVTLLAGGFFESRAIEPEFADIDTFAFQRIGVGVGAVFRLGDIDLRAAYGHIFSETLEVTPPPHQPVEEATAGDPQSGFDKRVGGTFDDEGTRVGGVVLEDPDAPSPSEADAVAAKTQRSAVATPARPDRVVNAGRYTASFDVLSVGVVYHF